MRGSLAPVDEPGGDVDELGAGRAGHASLLRGRGGGRVDGGGPAGEVVGEPGGPQPRAVGEEGAGGDVFEPGSFFQVADGEFDDGVVAVEGVGGHDVAVEVGQEGEVTPAGP